MPLTLRYTFLYLLIAFGYTQAERLKEGRWSTDKTSKPYEIVASGAWDHVSRGNADRIQEKRLEFLNVFDMRSLQIQSLKGTLKEPTAYDKVALRLNLGGYKIQTNGEIFGIDNKLVSM